MIPGMNPKQMQRAMQRMGIKQVEVPATEVVIKQEDKELVIINPQVLRVNMMGQVSYQITGETHEREKEQETLEISEEDIKTVAEKTGVSDDKAKEMLEQTKGDLAEAIINLSQQ